MPDTRLPIRQTEQTGLYRRDLGGGAVFENIVGVPGAVTSNEVLAAADGHKIERLEFKAPAA